MLKLLGINGVLASAKRHNGFIRSPFWVLTVSLDVDYLYLLDYHL